MKPLKYSNKIFIYTSKRTYVNFALAIMLFLYGINFHSTTIGLILFLLAIFRCFFVKIEKLRTALLPFFLIAFTTSYSIASYYFGFFSLFEVVTFVLTPIAFYLTGIYVIKKKVSVKLLFFYINLIIFSLFIFGIYCVGKTVYYDGIYNLSANVRTVSTPWTNVQFNATNLGAYFTMGLSLLGFIFTFKVKDLISIKLLYIIIIVLSIISELFLGNRTGLVIAVISIVTAYLVYNIYGPKQIRNKVTTTFVIITTILLVIYAIQSNIYGIGEKLLGSTLVIRLYDSNFFEDLRFKAWQAAFIGLFEHPFGGKQAYIPLNYAHNLWLDVGYAVGIIPFVILLIFTLLVCKDLVKLIRNKENPIELRILLTCVYVSLFINFFVEPILEGYFIHFAIFCFIVGMTSKYVRLTDKVTITGFAKTHNYFKNKGRVQTL